MKSRRIKMERRLYYGVDGQEKLCLDPEDVVKEFLEGDPEYDEYPIEVYEFEPVDVRDSLDEDRLASDIMGSLMASMDERFGDPDDHSGTSPTENMKIAAKNLAAVVIGEYSPWICKKTGGMQTYSQSEAEAVLS